MVAAAIADAHAGGFNPFGFRAWPLGAQIGAAIGIVAALALVAYAVGTADG